MRTLAKTWLCVLSLTAAVSYARTAAAGVPTTFDVRLCRASSRANDALLSRGPDNNHFLTNASAGFLTVFCPVTKKTSGPGIFNDNVLTTSVPFSGTSSLSCDLQTFSVGTAIQSGSSNFVDSFFGSATTSPLVIDSSWSSTPQGFWDGFGGAWYYDDVRCSLPNGATLKDYTITENGSTQPYRIFAPNNCKADDASTVHWRYLDYFGGGDALGGSIYSDASGGAGLLFRFNCPVPASSRVDISVGPAAGTHILGCSYDATATPQTWPSHPVGSNTNVFQILAFSGSPYIFIPSGTHKLVCDIQPLPPDGNGDGRIDAFRTAPGPVPTGTPTGGGSSAANALDHNLSTRWTTGTAQVNGQTFVVDLGMAIPFNKIKMDSTGSNNDYAHGYQVFASNSTSSWGSAIATGAGSGPVINVTFATQTTRYIKVVQTANDPSHWWSIYEFSVFKP